MAPWLIALTGVIYLWVAAPPTSGCTWPQKFDSARNIRAWPSHSLFQATRFRSLALA